MSDDTKFEWLSEVKTMYASGGRTALLLTDEHGVTTGYTLTADRLAALLVPLLGLMSEWADDLGQTPQTTAGRTCAKSHAIP